MKNGQPQQRRVCVKPASPMPESNGAIKSIAAATDFTVTAMAAVRRAAQLCRANGARMHLMHVLSPAGVNARAVMKALGTGSRMSASSTVSHLRHTASRIIAEFGIRVNTHVGVGNVSHEIGLQAQALGADLIALGNSRRNFFAEVLGINIALAVQRKTSVPVLAVSDPALRPYACLLLASDLSPGAARAGERAFRFFPESKIIVLHAFESPYTGMLGLANASRAVAADYRRRAELEGMERLRAFAREALLGGDPVLRVELEHPAISARRSVRECQVDLVVLRPSRRWLKSGVTQNLIADPPCDLLLMP